MSVSSYLENELLDQVFNNSAAPAVTNVYAKLHTGDPGEACTSNAATETDRVEVTFGVAASGTVTSDADTSWTNVAASETYTHISLWDNSTAGNALWYGALTAPKTVNSGDTFTIPAGDLTVTLE